MSSRRVLQKTFVGPGAILGHQLDEAENIVQELGHYGSAIHERLIRDTGILKVFKHILKLKEDRLIPIQTQCDALQQRWKDEWKEERKNAAKAARKHAAYRKYKYPDSVTDSDCDSCSCEDWSGGEEWSASE